mgnify:CR=1 FL=1
MRNCIECNKPLYNRNKKALYCDYLCKGRWRHKYNKQYKEYQIQYNKTNKRKKQYKEYDKCKSPEFIMLWRSIGRARKKKIEHNIDVNDIVITEFCPLLHIKLEKGDGKSNSNSPSLDRIDSTKGYVKGNVWVISKRANTAKSDLSLTELELLVTNLKNRISNAKSIS